MKAVLPRAAYPLLAPQLPPALEVAWFDDVADAKAGLAGAEIAWVDMQPPERVAEVLMAAGPELRWLSTLYAGLDAFPIDRLRASGTRVTNGAGINAHAVAEYAVMAVLVAAKRYDQVVRAQASETWPADAPGKIGLNGTRALVVGYGTIGRLIGERLAAFGVAVTGVTRSGRDGTIAANAWQARLGTFDWVVLAAPATRDTARMIDAAALAAMKATAWLVNIARGSMVDGAALVAALRDGTIAGAFLDPTDPEPLPAGHPLWSAPNCLMSMHLSGRSQTTMFQRGAALFLRNLAAYRAGTVLENEVDLAAGY